MATRMIVFMIPVLAYIWTAEFDRKFAEFNVELHDVFVTKRDAELRLVSRELFDQTVGLHNGIISLHGANSDIHLGRADVVTKDLYESNRLADRADLKDLKEDIAEIKQNSNRDSAKLDRLLEMILTEH